MNKIFAFVLVAAALLLQGCATGRSNLLCADGCRAGAPTAQTQWSQQLNDNMYVHPQYVDLYVHRETDAWEPSQTCGTPGLLRTLSYSLVQGLVQGVAYETVNNGLLAGTLSGTVNGVIGQMNQSSLSKVCRDAATVAAQHNARPDVARKIIHWNMKRRLEENRLQQEAMNEIQGVQNQGQALVQNTRPQYGTYEYCAVVANQNGGLQQKIDHCARDGRNFGFVRTSDGREGCGCQPKT